PVAYILLQKHYALALEVKAEGEFVKHRRAQNETLAEARVHRRRAEINLIELIGQNLDVNLTVFAIERKESRKDFGVFYNISKWLQRFLRSLRLSLWLLRCQRDRCNQLNQDT